MKKFTLLFSVLCLVACNSDDNNETPSNELSLIKTVTFTPSEAAYNNQTEGSRKNVKYYENNHVVADTTYYENQTVYSIINHQYTNNTYKTTVYFDQSTIPFSATERTYDNQNRLIQLKNTYFNPDGSEQTPGGGIIFTYTPQSIIRESIDPDTNLVMPQYTIENFTNSNGLINYTPYNGGASTSLEFDYDKLYQAIDNNGGGSIGTKAATYYSQPVPVNQIKTIAELNNIMLESRYEEVFLYGNYYCMTLTGTNTNISLESTFNESGYITYSKQTESFVEDYPAGETYYYYN
ncbi:hypothetical protein [Flavobacterium beibuense]|uniref:Uncharacterized protein n=1 Tax=Flavobacterium beibuense TaxID=657326 RepID=A0A444W7X4_9FLAO|nr:hypothetical protein [Flavobacterium beibuense]RYJ41979.1 hypothetical protein NU09_2383 [Flavobacterium beibuense]